MADVLSVENLSKKYRETIAVEGISFDVKAKGPGSVS